MRNLTARTLPRTLPRTLRGRRGSILILVVALLVLLALIGTAYLTSTQTERQTAGQATVNTQVDLVMTGFTAAVNDSVVSGLYGTNPAGGVANYNPNVYTGLAVNEYAGQPLLRYPGQQSDTPLGPSILGQPAQPVTGFFPTQVSNYRGYTSAQTDAFLGDRVPTSPPSVGVWQWGSISWPPFPDANGNYVFENPYEGSVNLGPATNRPNLSYRPTVKVINGKVLPAMQIVVSPLPVSPPLTATVPVGLPNFNVVIGPGNVNNPGSTVMAVSASGDGVADSMLVKMPGGPVNGVTYYAAMRVIDNNSAVDASTAWSANPVGAAGGPVGGAFTQLTIDAATAGTLGSPYTYGFFKSDVDLSNLLNPNPVAPPGYSGVVPSTQQELFMLNRYRFGGDPPSAGFPTNPDMRAALNLNVMPVDDMLAVGGTSYRTRSDFAWYSSSEALDVLLAERPGNPGVANVTPGGAVYRMRWLGWDEAANLAYKFTLHNPATPASPLETALYNELYANARTLPFAAGDGAASGAWTTQFNYGPQVYSITPNVSLRPLLTAANPVSNATPSRFTNPVGLPGSPWVPGVQYRFGDWVTGRDGRAYVCTLPHPSSDGTIGGSVTNDPVPAALTVATAADPDRFFTPNPASIGLWAGVRVADPGANLAHGTTFGTDPSRTGLPFTQTPVKTSINTGSFGQLWLGFAQVMTDSVGIPPFSTPATTNLPQWLPPMQTNTLGGATPITAGMEPQMPIWRSVVRPMTAAAGALPTGIVTDDTTTTVGATPIKRLSPAQMLKLRAALAAVNAMDLRDADADVTSRRIILNASNGTPEYEVEVFGTEVQPFIGGVYAHVDPTDPIHNNFVAIQLLNPYDVPITVDPAKGWKFGLVDRINAAGAGTSRLTMTNLSAASGPFVAFTIPPKTALGPGIAVIESATNKPIGVVDQQPFGGLPPTQVPGLETVIGKYELFVMKPRLYNGVGPSVRLSTAGANDEYYNENNVYDLVPADQIDMTALPATTTLDGPFDFYYRRASAASQATKFGWNFVWPGTATPATAQYGPFVTLTPPQVPTNADLTVNYAGAADPTGQSNPYAPTYTTLPLVLNNTFNAGPNRLYADPTDPAGATFNSPPLRPTDLGPANRFPYGGFGRNGDMLQIPFIGAYRIRKYDPTNSAATTTFLEMNSVTADSAYADDTTLTMIAKPTGADTSDTLMREQLGRFCPVGDPTSGTTTGLADFGPPTDPTIGTSPYWHYHWAARLFDYFDVRPNADDYYPNVDPMQSDMTTTPYLKPKYYAGAATPTIVPHPVANLSATVANNITAGSSEGRGRDRGADQHQHRPGPGVGDPAVDADADDQRRHRQRDRRLSERQRPVPVDLRPVPRPVPGQPVGHPARRDAADDRPVLLHEARHLLPRRDRQLRHDRRPGWRRPDPADRRLRRVRLPEAVLHAQPRLEPDHDPVRHVHLLPARPGLPRRRHEHADAGRRTAKGVLHRPQRDLGHQQPAGQPPDPDRVISPAVGPRPSELRVYARGFSFAGHFAGYISSRSGTCLYRPGSPSFSLSTTWSTSPRLAVPCVPVRVSSTVR